MFMLSRQVNETVDVVFVNESLAKVKSQTHYLTTREEMKMHEDIYLLLLS